MRDQLANHIDLSDYVLGYAPDGTSKLIRKDLIVDYKPQFSMDMVNGYEAPSSVRKFCSTQYETDPKYFANKFKDVFAEKVFHCLGNYRYPGFREYVKKLPGFDDFILSMGEQLKPGSALHQKLFEQDFAALKNMHQTKMYELEQKAQAKHQADLRQNLRASDFSEHGIKLLEHHGVSNQFLYQKSFEQSQQFEHIVKHLNKTGDFWQEHQRSPDLMNIADLATQFGIMSNRALQYFSQSLSQELLRVGQNFLALGRGLARSGEHTINAVCQLIAYPIETFQNICTSIKNIGIGIGKAITLVPRFQVAVDFGDAEMLAGVNADIDRYCEKIGGFCHGIKYILHDASEIEQMELIGSLSADILTMHLGGKAWSALQQTAPVRFVAGYKSLAWAKLGDLGREINQIAGFALTKGTEALQRGFEAIKNHPKLIHAHQFLGEAILAGEAELLMAEGLGFANEIEAGLKILQQDSQIASIGSVNANNLAKIAQFETGAAKLASTYGAETVEEARIALRINEYKLAKNCENKLLQELENTCANIKKVKTKPHRHDFIYDVDHGFKATECSVMEGLTACAVEDQGFVKQLQRATKKGVDFVDELGREWDIKSPISKTPLHPYASFRADKIVTDIISEMKRGESIIIDITNVIESDFNLMLAELRSQLSGNKIKDILIVHRDIAVKSGFFY
jgi:hypothetical protein